MRLCARHRFAVADGAGASDAVAGQAPFPARAARHVHVGTSHDLLIRRGVTGSRVRPPRTLRVIGGGRGPSLKGAGPVKDSKIGVGDLLSGVRRGMWATLSVESGSGIGPQGRPRSGRRSLTPAPSFNAGSAIWGGGNVRERCLPTRRRAVRRRGCSNAWAVVGGQARGGAAGHPFAAVGAAWSDTASRCLGPINPHDRGVAVRPRSGHAGTGDRTILTSQCWPGVARARRAARRTRS
jgi:hypothetical protein